MPEAPLMAAGEKAFGVQVRSVLTVANGDPEDRQIKVMSKTVHKKF
jgi:hypothetical protein